MSLARIARPRGVRGEVIADGDSSGPERLLRLPRTYLFPPGEPAKLEAAWVHDGRLVLKFQGVDSRNAAEALRNAELRIPLEDRPEPEEGEYYFADLVGCQLLDHVTGRGEGEVTGWQDLSGQVLLEVARPGEKEPMLVPFARAICREIDVGGRRILVDLPQGLKELEP